MSRGSGGTSGGPDLSALIAALQARASLCYPERARRFRVTGRGEVSFCVDAEGVSHDVTLASSTGSPLLDEAALDCLLGGPDPLPIRGGCYRLPVRFEKP